MVNKSMMHTHASGCHKRRSLPAHSLAAAVLFLLLAFSCPLIVRADANFFKENIFNNIYLQNKISESINREYISYYQIPEYLKKQFYKYAIYNNTNNILFKNTNDAQLIIESKEQSQNTNNEPLIIENGEHFTIYGYNDENDAYLKKHFIVKDGHLEVSKYLENIESLTMYGGTQVTNNITTITTEDNEQIKVQNISFKENAKIIIDITNGTLDLSSNNAVLYNGFLDAKNSNFIFNLSSLHNDSIYYGTLLFVSGGCDISGSTLNISVSGDIDISKGYTLSLMEIVGDKIITNNIKTLNSSIKIGSTIISGNGFEQILREYREENPEHEVYPIPDYSQNYNNQESNGDINPSESDGDQEVPKTERVTIYLDVLPSENGTIDGAKGISEGYLSGLMLTLQGADLVATRGMQAAMAATKEVEDVTFTPWATVSGSSVRYNTGAHADLNSFNMLTGIALGKGFDAGRVTVGAFFEYGTGSYKTSNSFDGHGSYDGKGDSYYLGWGLLARMDFADTGPGHFYVEGSGRMGGLYNNYSNGDLRDGFGREAEYDSYAPYYSFHAGLGYIWDINEQTSLEFYGKYLWTRECGDSVTLSTGEEVDFEDIDSSRLRFGTRLDYRVNEYITPYIGVAWEHEFDGESSATTNNLPILEPDLRGDTGIGEIGLTITPSETIPLTVDLGVTGYVGTREGISGSLLVKWTF